MAATEYEINRDEQERSNLRKAAADLETAIVVSNPGTRRLLELSLAGIRARVATLDKRIEEAKTEHAAEVQAQAVAAAALAAKETKLNEEERETYRRFVEKAYFTKKDLGSLDEFYRHSYDRLSESGKEQMSQRIDEGIRRGEFKFDELPKDVLEKETKHRATRTDEKAPTQTRSDESELSKSPKEPTQPPVTKDVDLASVDLSGIKLAEAIGAPNSAAIPDASDARVRTR